MQEIPYEVKSFINDNIHSVWQLDLLIVLMNVEGSTNSATLARLLCFNQVAIESALQNFENSGLIEKNLPSASTYIFAPRTEEKRRIIESTAKTYSVRRIDVINLIFSPSRHGSISKFN